MVKIIMTLILPFVLLYDIFARIWYEVENIPSFIISDLKQEIDHYIKIMKE